MSDWDGPELGATANRCAYGQWWAENVEVVDPPGASNPALPVALELARANVIEVLGEGVYRGMVELLATSPDARRRLWDEQRNRWWVIRNAASCEQQTVSDAVWHTLAFGYMLEDAGVPVDTLRRLSACASHGCVCEGCDLWNGDRLLC